MEGSPRLRLHQPVLRRQRLHRPELGRSGRQRGDGARPGQRRHWLLPPVELAVGHSRPARLLWPHPIEHQRRDPSGAASGADPHQPGQWGQLHGRDRAYWRQQPPDGHERAAAEPVLRPDDRGTPKSPAAAPDFRARRVDGQLHHRIERGTRGDAPIAHRVHIDADRQQRFA